MNELALFAGAGGGLLATTHLLKWRTVCYVEWDTYCIDVLKARIKDGYLHDAPIWDDVQTFDGHPWAGCVDIITAGFPCQPFSTAGKRNGSNDDRNMWPATIRIIREVRPAWVLLENVPGLLSAMDDSATLPHSYAGTVLGDLAQSGYDARWRVLSAAEVGAPHKRDRFFIVAHPKSERGQPQPESISENDTRTRANKSEQFIGSGENVADAKGQPIRTGLCESKPPEQWGRRSGNSSGAVSITRKQRLAQREGAQRQRAHSPIARGDWWTTEPALGRVANGVAHRVDRLKAIGNGQVSAVVSTVWRLLTEE